MLPMSYSGLMVLTGAESIAPSDLVPRLCSALEKRKPSSIEADESGVGFTAGVFRLVGSWNLLVAI